MPRIAILGGTTTTDHPDAPAPARAAVCVHGVFATMAEARAAVQAMALAPPPSGDAAAAAAAAVTDAFVIDACRRWLPVRAPLPGTAEEEEEVAAAANDNAGEGRMGSVCDVRRPKGTGAASSSSGAAVQIETAAPAPRSTPLPAQVLEGVASGGAAPPSVETARATQRSQLDDLIRAPVPDAIPDGPAGADAYAALRLRCATLRAFERRLRALYAEGLTRVRAALDGIAALDAAHPEHAGRYLDHYRKALRESGLRDTDVPFMRFLRAEPA